MHNIVYVRGVENVFGGTGYDEVHVIGDLSQTNFKDVEKVVLDASNGGFANIPSADRFHFRSAVGSASLPDIIENFNVAHDAFVFDAGDLAGGSCTFIGDQGFSGNADGLDSEARLVATATGFNLQIDLDGNGAADLLIQLQNLQGDMTQLNFI
mgnify:CR=1 FL=1